MNLIRNRLLRLTVAIGSVSLLGAQSADSPDPAAMAAHAVQLQQAGDFTAAAEAYQNLLKLNDNDVASHVNLGVVLVQLGRYDEAIAQYEEANKLLPGDPRIALNLALAYQKSGRLQEAVQRLQTLHESFPQENRFAMLLADCDLQMGEDQRVIDLLQPLQAQNPDDLGLAYMLGMALIRTQRTEEGQVLLDRILRNGDSAEARFLLGTRMFESGDYPAAVKQLAGAAELNPKLPQLQSLYGRALLTTGDADGAVRAFQAELSTNPNDYPSNLGLGQILAARKRYEEAAPLLQRALQLRSQSAEPKLSLAECLNGLGKFADARPLAEAAQKAKPDSVEAHQTLADTYAGLHLTAQAVQERQMVQNLQKETSASAAGPKLREMAPDFRLANAVTGKQVSLRDFRGKTPVVLVFGSYSCPNFRGSADALKTLYGRYGSRMPFLLVYIREAHAGANWQSTRNEREGVEIAETTTLQEKQEHATMCSRKLHLPFPALVDKMDGATETAYQAWPSRAFIVGEDGRILYSSRLTELDFHPEQMEAVLRHVASQERASGK